jgi:hypothetical protein
MVDFKKSDYLFGHFHHPNCLLKNDVLKAGSAFVIWWK